MMVMLKNHCPIKRSASKTNGDRYDIENRLNLPCHHQIMAEIFYIIEVKVEFTLDCEMIIAKPKDPTFCVARSKVLRRK